MNTHDNDGNHHDGVRDDMSESLRWSLLGLRREVAPERDLWPAIAARIAIAAQQPAAAATARAPHVPFYRRPVLLAMAASLLVAVGIGWQLRPARMAGNAVDPDAQLIAREADAMTLEYGAALRELDTGKRPLAGQTALHELDRSAAQVRMALARDPDARFLLDRLQSVYARRLALTQRLAALT